jgi:peroxiredoxin
MSREHDLLCRVRVGDTMPAITLNQLGGSETELARLYGKTATVVVFWEGTRRMGRTLLADLNPDVVSKFGGQGVAVVGIAVNQRAEDVRAAADTAAASFPILLDPEGKAFALVGKEKMPRVYLLDPQGKVLWFDIEYSLATRRELNQSLLAVTASRKSQE